jgi:hypothetical protein
MARCVLHIARFSGDDSAVASTRLQVPVTVRRAAVEYHLFRFSMTTLYSDYIELQQGRRFGEGAACLLEHGFADTSFQDLENAAGVNKSGLYAEFADKGDLYSESLRYYLRKRQKEELLTASPLGWKNIERFLNWRPAAWKVRKAASQSIP